ncbi:MAG: hydroxymethylglutaryl-CoA reductase, degradative [Euryarchaeota archaeon]|nr:hydroxymethylglutaryl-CoA reductase, degradative [Euryarchaeota archaeon]
MEKSSEVSGFYKRPVEERLSFVKEWAGLADEEVATLRNTGGLPLGTADRMIENVVGGLTLPMGLGVNFRINGRDLLVPMVIEEPSVVAAASNAAKMARARGGFTASFSGPVMIAQVQLVEAPDPEAARKAILARRDEILSICNRQDPMLVQAGGGARDIEVRVLETSMGKMVVTHLLVDTRDAMGANAVNTMAEAIAPYIEEWTKGRVYLRILSNLAVHRLARATAVFDREAIGGEGVVEGILNASAFAEADPFRAATHNKGIMNGVSSVVLATGNDTRAIEAGAHAYAARSGRYSSLSRYERDAGGNLVGTLELPMAVGIVGGATKTHPVARIALKILDIKSAAELAQVIACVGLAQNLAALRALATEGIQRGHMGLHARNVAASAGATGELVDRIADQMVKEKKVRADRAKELLGEYSRKK